MLDDKRRFERGSEWNRDGRKFQSHYLIRCSKCSDLDRLRFNRYTNTLPPDLIGKRFAQRGWVIGATRSNDLCPKCVAALVDDRHKREDQAKEQRRKAEAALATSKAKLTPDQAEVPQGTFSRRQLVLLDRASDLARGVAYVSTMMDGLLEQVAELQARQARLTSMITDPREELQEKQEKQEKMFIPIADQKSPPAALPDTVKLAHYSAKNGAITAITISGSISKQIGVNAKSRIRILRGTDEDEGKLRLEVCAPSDKAPGTYSVTGLHGSGAARIITAKVRPKNKGIIKAVVAQHVIDGQALLVDLPAAFV